MPLIIQKSYIVMVCLYQKYIRLTTKPLTSFFHINVKIENGKNNNYFENNKFQMLEYVTY